MKKYNHLTTEERYTIFVLLRQKYACIRADKKNGRDLWTHCRHQLKQRKRKVSAPYVDPSLTKERPIGQELFLLKRENLRAISPEPFL